jgi:hypothetical protein
VVATNADADVKLMRPETSSDDSSLQQWHDVIVKKVLDVVCGGAVSSHTTGNTDFQITRGRVGVSV